MADTDKLAHHVAGLIGDSLPGFRYIRSRCQFRARHDESYDDMIVNVSSKSGTRYIVSFIVGVQNTEIASTLANIECRKTTPYDRTIHQNSINAGDQTLIPYSGEGFWPVNRESSFRKELPAMLDFVERFAVPYHDRFSDLHAIRDSLVTRDGLNIAFQAYKAVLAIDAVLNDLEHAREYLELLQSEIYSGYRHDPVAFNEFYACFKARYSEFTDFTLMSK